MYALEEEPEGKGRWRRLSMGALLSIGVTAVLFAIAQKIEPARRLLADVVQFAVVEEPPPPPPPPEPVPPPPPPPPPKPKPKEEEPPPEPEPEPEPEELPPEPEPELEPEAEENPEPAPDQAGLDSSSFAEGGGGGPSFGAGRTQMGDPSRRGGHAAIAASDANATRFVSAVSLSRIEPEYSLRARRRRIEGFVIVEAQIDEQGTPTAVKVHQSLDPDLDEAALAAVRRWRFRPAMLGGKPKSSTHMIRIHFRLR